MIRYTNEHGTISPRMAEAKSVKGGRAQQNVSEEAPRTSRRLSCERAGTVRQKTEANGRRETQTCDRTSSRMERKESREGTRNQPKKLSRYETCSSDSLSKLQGTRTGRRGRNGNASVSHRTRKETERAVCFVSRTARERQGDRPHRAYQQRRKAHSEKHSVDVSKM
jgi:hypothetical protein